MRWPSHLADDVRFGHAAAHAAADGLRDLARRLEDHAARRAAALADATHFVGPARHVTDERTRRDAARARGLAVRLRREAATLEDEARRARRDAHRLADARAAWAARQLLS